MLVIQSVMIFLTVHLLNIRNSEEGYLCLDVGKDADLFCCAHFECMQKVACGSRGIQGDG